MTMMPTFFLCFSASPLKERLLLVLEAARPFADTGAAFIEGPRTLVDNMQKLIGATPWGSKVEGHAPGSLPVSTHNKNHQGQPLTLSL